MREPMTPAEVEAAFVSAVDGALPEAEAQRLRDALAGDAELRERFARYERTVTLLREAPRERAPQGLAGLVLRRARRRRFSLQVRRLTEAHRFPVEIIVPIVLAAVVAALLLIG